MVDPWLCATLRTLSKRILVLEGKVKKPRIQLYLADLIPMHGNGDDDKKLMDSCGPTKPPGVFSKAALSPANFSQISKKTVHMLDDDGKKLDMRVLPAEVFDGKDPHDFDVMTHTIDVDNSHFSPRQLVRLERVQQYTAEQIVDVPFPQKVEETLESDKYDQARAIDADSSDFSPHKVQSEDDDHQDLLPGKDGILDNAAKRALAAARQTWFAERDEAHSSDDEAPMMRLPSACGIFLQARRLHMQALGVEVSQMHEQLLREWRGLERHEREVYENEAAKLEAEYDDESLDDEEEIAARKKMQHQRQLRIEAKLKLKGMPGMGKGK